MRWDEMSMSQKSEAIGLMVRNGVTDIGTMKQMWDDMDGRKKKKPSYAEWVKGVNPLFVGSDYNLKAAYDELPFETMEAWRRDPNANHLPDTYKLPSHPTFSLESKDPVTGMKGGAWLGDRFYPSQANRLFNPDIYPHSGAYMELPYGYMVPETIQLPKPALSFAEGGFTSPDHDQNNPYHYHVNGQKVVVTPEDWEKYKDDPTFREVRAAVEAEQAAHPEPEYDEIENPAWRTAYQRIGVTQNTHWNGSKFVLPPLPEGYSRDSRGVAMDAKGNYYAPVKDMSYWNPNVPFFVNNERSMVNGNTVPVRYEQVQMPERTIRQLRQPLPVDRVMDVDNIRKASIDSYIENHTTPKKKIHYINSAFVSYLYPELATKSSDKTEYNRAVKSAKKLGFKVLDNYTPEQFNSFLIGFNDIDFEKWKKEMYDRFGDGENDVYFDNTTLNETINSGKTWRDGPNGSMGYQVRYEGGSPSHQEAEKKAVISIGDLEKVGTFSEGGNIDDPPDKKPAIPVGGYLPDYYPSQQEWLRNWFGNREEQIKDNFKGIALGVIGFDPSRSIPVQYVERAIDGSMKVPVKYQSIFNDPDNPTSAYNRDTRQIIIDPNMQDIESTMLHERTHALNHQLPQRVVGQQGYEMSPIESKVRDVMMPWYKENEQDLDEYWDDPVEIYARMMQMRYRLNLDPTKKVTKDDLNKWRKDGLLRQYEMGVYDDDTLLQLFNEVADNRQMQNNQRNTYVIPTDIGLGYI